MSGCAYRRDPGGNVIYDDPTCPTRYRQSHRAMGSSYENVNLTKESAFFDRYIEKRTKRSTTESDDNKEEELTFGFKLPFRAGLDKLQA